MTKGCASPDISPALASKQERYAVCIVEAAAVGSCSFFEQIDQLGTNFPLPPKINMSGTHSYSAMEERVLAKR